jgi:hypothetical protein
MNNDLLILLGLGALLFYSQRSRVLPNGGAAQNGIMPTVYKPNSPVSYGATDEELRIRDIDDRGIYGRNPFILMPYPSVAARYSGILGRGWEIHTRPQTPPPVWSRVNMVV